MPAAVVAVTKNVAPFVFPACSFKPGLRTVEVVESFPQHRWVGQVYKIIYIIIIIMKGRVRIHVHRESILYRIW